MWAASGQPQQFPVHGPDAGGYRRWQGLASLISGALFGYRRPQILMMWSLTMPKVAATLATAFIGFQAGLLNQTVLNARVGGDGGDGHPGTDPDGALGHPSGRDASGHASASFGEEMSALEGVSEVVQRPLRIVVANPSNEQGLLSMASRLLRGSAGGDGLLLPLAMVNPEPGGGARWSEPGPSRRRAFPAEGGGAIGADLAGAHPHPVASG